MKVSNRFFSCFVVLFLASSLLLSKTTHIFLVNKQASFEIEREEFFPFYASLCEVFELPYKAAGSPGEVPDLIEVADASYAMIGALGYAIYAISNKGEVSKEDDHSLLSNLFNRLRNRQPFNLLSEPVEDVERFLTFLSKHVSEAEMRDGWLKPMMMSSWSCFPIYEVRSNLIGEFVESLYADKEKVD